MRKALITFAIISLFAMIALAAVPTTLEDLHLAGTQPNQVTLEGPTRCGNCHGDYDPVAEPYANWQGSMMGQAMRDPLFRAFMTIAEQDAPGSGDLCIRCHTPEGWLEGRSTPTDGSSLVSRDFEGITCDFCHKLVKPSELGVNPFPDDPDYTSTTYEADQATLATLADIPPQSGNGMYIVSGDNHKRGPFVDAAAKHKMLYSPFHSEAALCGTCHDVSNPVFSRNADNTYSPNDFDFRTPSYDTYEMYPVERTYSEWLMSDYNSAEGVPSDVFGGNKANVSTCQDCHMKDVSGYGANKRGIPYRDDIPMHDLTGGNTFVPKLVGQLYPNDVVQADLDAGIARATNMLQNAASMDVSVTPQGTEQLVDVKITNETGHKLPSGYPDGRRIWINVKAYDGSNLIYESGAYDDATAVLTHDHDVKIYEIEPGISADLAPVIGYPAGPSFHFVLNNDVYKDNRIPPRGFTNANFETIQSPVVGYTYNDGQYWDNTQYLIPGSATNVEVNLYYQTTSKEFIEFLRDENHTDTLGQLMYDLWNTNGKAAPVLMNNHVVQITTNPPVTEFVGTPVSGNAPLSVNFTDQSSNTPTSWNWNFGDGSSSTEQNPIHLYQTAGVYSVSLTSTNSYGSSTLTKTDYINITELTITEMHVAALIVTRASGKGNKVNGIATATIFDANNSPVEGALVAGDFTGASNGSASAITDVNGVAVISSKPVRSPSGVFCFTVTSVVLTDALYNESANLLTSICENTSLVKYGSELTPNSFGLAQNYPNPFNPTTDISFSIPTNGYVTLSIYNTKGQKVDNLVQSTLSSGIHTISWDASKMASGMYLYRLEYDGQSLTNKMLLLK